MAPVYALCILSSIVSGVWLDTVSRESSIDFSDRNKVEQRGSRRAEAAQFTLFESSAPALNFTSFDALPASTK